MCDVCVMTAVKSRMLSRRDLFRAAAAGTAAVAATTGTFPAMAQAPRTVTDMTHELSQAFPTYFGAEQFFVDKQFDFAKDGFNLYELRVNEHTGTHVDAPLHFSADGQSVAEIPVANLVAPLCIVDIRAKAAESADTQVTPDDLKAWIAAHGAIPEGACVAMNSGWDRHVATEKFRNADGDGTMHFPGFHVEAVQMLMEEAGVIGIAVDTLSLDYGMSKDFAVHYAWLPSNRWGIECIANLDALPASGATLIVGAPKHRGGTGGPARVLALT
ncbi:cyclase family protein [Polymorphum gilvum]|uniref:Cyclase family protein n=1 Tax=Polymorphum gilvum (strain LMG 25793 / CGMCC 1.9160 / SL003B-26A1) TaxID=991905 RepID=F2IYG0_POLGS|nr:cyclase family protein [Polymorphum gilvum]ADZ68473.1 Cyclase family protein [Polymorphum gilvum SL003B-26A1]